MLSPEQKTKLRAAIDAPAYAGLPDSLCADRLNAIPMVPNPSPQPTRPRAIQATEIFGLLSPETVGKVAAIGLLGHLDNLIWNQDRERIGMWVAAFLLPTGNCSESEAAAVASYLAATDPDPTWSPTVRGESDGRTLFGDEPVEWTDADGFERSAIGYCLPDFVAEARRS